MAVLTLSQPIDVLQTAITNVGQGTIQSHSSTSFVAKNPDTDDSTLDSDDLLVSFSGTGFGNFDSNGVPHSGTITQIQTQDFMSNPTATLSGISIAVSDFLNFVSGNNLSGLETALFSDDDTINGSTGNDNVSGFGGNDTFNMTNGGNDVVSGGDGNDVFNFGAAFTAADQVDGGAGTDTLSLNGDYSTGLTLAANTLVNVENITLATGHSYNLTTNDANVASAQTLAVDGSALGSSNTLTFNGAAETDGNFTLTGGAGNDVLTGGAGADTFVLTAGGNDTATGGAGNDTFNFGAVFTAADKIDGGAGIDVVNLSGDYSAGLTFAATTMVNVETLNLGAGFSYKLTTNNATVAAGQTLTVDGSALGSGNILTFNGSAETDGKFVIHGGAGNDVITGGAGDDVITGGAGNNVFILSAGGNDTATGGAGNDTFGFGAAFTAADKVDGGAGTDKITLNGDYSAGLTFGATTMVNVETLSMTAGHNYNLTTNDANVAAGQTLIVDASALGSANAFTFNGSAETDGRFSIAGGAGNDNLTGGAGNDAFTLSGGGNDTVAGGAGNDTFSFGAAFTAADKVDGGAGTDKITLNGDYSAGLTFGATTMVNVETLSMTAGHNYNLTTNDANVAAGQTLIVDASALGSANALTFNGAAETDGRFSITGGAGNDNLTGGAGNDAITGGTGNDTLTGGGGGDRFVFHNGDGNDTITDFVAGNAGTDVIQLSGYGITSFSALQSHMAQSGADTIITFDANNHITLHNVTMTDLNSGDFIFS